MNDNTIALARFGKDVPDHPWAQDGDKLRLVVTAQLHQIGGNAHPHFSITADLVNLKHRRGSHAFDVAGGCLHDDILAAFPECAPLVALHLADDDGTPMHAVANGAYFLGFTEYQEHNGAPLPAYDIFARSWRITEDQAREARAWVPMYNGPAVDALGVLALAMAPRWQDEANAGLALIRELASKADHEPND